MLDKMLEEALEVILKEYDGNESNNVNGSYDLFPEYMQFSFGDIFDGLKYAGILASNRTPSRVGKFI